MKTKHARYLKIYTQRKRYFLGLPDISVAHLDGTRDKFRELVRARDGCRCRKCKAQWSEGMRRFDVHHMDENKDGKSRFPMMHKYDISHMKRLITLCHKCHMNLPVTRKRMSKKASPIRKLRLKKAR